MKTILNSKKTKIIIGVLVLLFMGLYEWILNTSDEFGYRCQTFYNLSKYKLIAVFFHIVTNRVMPPSLHLFSFLFISLIHFFIIDKLFYFFKSY